MIEGSSFSPLLPWVVHRPAALARAGRFSSGPTRTPGETINRINQDARPKATAANSRPVRGADSALETDRLVRDRTQDQPGDQAERSSRAYRHPAGLACQERSIRPRVNHANEVVMPQVGHSRPVTVEKRTGPEDQAECACRNPAGPAPTFSPPPKAPPDRPPRPETNSESANPAVDEQTVAGSWVALRLHGRFRADRARMRGL